MSKLFFSVLQRALALFAAVLNDPEVREFLMSIGFPMDWLSQGNSRVERVKAAVAEHDVLASRRRGVKEALVQMWRNVRSEVASLRFVALRAFASRPDLIEAFSLAPRKHPHAEETKSPPPADGATPPAPAKEAKKKQPPRDALGASIAKGRALVTGIMAEPGAIALLGGFGYGTEQLTTLASRLDALEANDVEHKDAAAAVKGASAEAKERGKEFRLWFVPWRKLLTKALAGRPEMKERLALPKR